MKSAWKGPAKGNCRGGVQDNDKENVDEPLRKWSRKKAAKHPLDIISIQS